MASLKEGETVLDLGSGGGFVCFLAAKQAGPQGHVLGVDMTPDMVAKARKNAAQLGAHNVEFRLGEIEHLPVADQSVDVIMSNCGINLSPDKAAVFREAFRVLKPGGRIAISDVVATAPLPAASQQDAQALAGCVAGAAAPAAIEGFLHDAGLTAAHVDVKPQSRDFIKDWLPGSRAEVHIASATISATRPNPTAACCGPSCR